LTNNNEVDNGHEYHATALPDIKNFKSPLLAAISPMVLPVSPTYDPKNEESILEYGLLEKQFKLILRRSQLSMNERFSISRYSDSFINYQNIDFKNETSIYNSMKEKETESDMKFQTEKNNMVTEEKEEKSTEENTAITEKEKENISSRIKRLPKSFFKNKNTEVTVQRSLSESFKPKNTNTRPPRKESIRHFITTKINNQANEIKH